MSYITFEASRTGYGPEQVTRQAMTVSDLMEILSGMEPDTKVIFSNDNGYTYGPITWESVSDEQELEEEEW